MSELGSNFIDLSKAQCDNKYCYYGDNEGIFLPTVATLLTMQQIYSQKILELYLNRFEIFLCINSLINYLIKNA